MSSQLNVACLQNCAGTDVQQNLQDLRVMIDQARADGAELVCLPEYGTCLGVDGSNLLSVLVPKKAIQAWAFCPMWQRTPASGY